jgi:hypothetical protein
MSDGHSLVPQIVAYRGFRLVKSKRGSGSTTQKHTFNQTISHSKYSHLPPSSVPQPTKPDTISHPASTLLLPYL